eukprot:CAMPEP_0175742340 /NCGR_PEP_ID=MMETSP0097-20121207/56485_1 /TAXON_ID=311494 /ORGANISM="Alexandrium monilatum, Strain CCMP3105" /LENGTH=331 /DNA_ID=CAMNT_0017050663 /DNA_START=47 /DNA_END=1038 /DNA_ORIENTATION=+
MRGAGRSPGLQRDGELPGVVPVIEAEHPPDRRRAPPAHRLDPTPHAPGVLVETQKSPNLEIAPEGAGAKDEVEVLLQLHAQGLPVGAAGAVHQILRDRADAGEGRRGRACVVCREVVVQGRHGGQGLDQGPSQARHLRGLHAQEVGLLRVCLQHCHVEGRLLCRTSARHWGDKLWQPALRGAAVQAAAGPAEAKDVLGLWVCTKGRRGEYGRKEGLKSVTDLLQVLTLLFEHKHAREGGQGLHAVSLPQPAFQRGQLLVAGADAPGAPLGAAGPNDKVESIVPEDTETGALLAPAVTESGLPDGHREGLPCIAHALTGCEKQVRHAPCHLG